VIAILSKVRRIENGYFGVPTVAYIAFKHETPLIKDNLMTQ